MATFKTTIKKEKKRADGTWNVLIRFTHKRKIHYFSTTMYVTKADITPSFKIKNQQIIDKCDELIRLYRKIIMPLNLEFNDMSMEDIVDYIKKSNNRNHAINFTEYYYKWYDEHRNTIKGIKNYASAFHAFQYFQGRNNILHTDITVNTLKSFSESLADKPRAQSLYTALIVRMFNDMREYYNDEDNGIIRIKHSLTRFKPPRQNVTKKRALNVEQIRKIFSLPYDGIMVKGRSSRRDLALDCFRLSFALMGMNSADMFSAKEYDGEKISYERAKTKDRRADRARIEVKVYPKIMNLMHKYAGKDRVFNFHERFKSESDLNRSINIGLKEIGKEIGVEHLQFYAARHSMATIAVNDVGISKYIVNDMLNHTDEALRVTELYIKKSFKAINEANFQLLDYVFNTTKK